MKLGIQVFILYYNLMHVQLLFYGYIEWHS